MITVPSIVAHRGSSASAPENTLPAFDQAWRDGADGIECDVRLTADGRVVCIHDADTKRVAGESLIVAETDFADLGRLDVGVWKGAEFAGTRIALLGDVLERSPQGKQVYIEAKIGTEIVAPLIEVIDRSPIDPTAVTVIAFDSAVVAAVKQSRPELRAYWLVNARSGLFGRSDLDVGLALQKVKDVNADGLGVQFHRGLNQKLVRSIRDADLALNVWTVDDPHVARRLASFGATSITANSPALIRNALG